MGFWRAHRGEEAPCICAPQVVGSLRAPHDGLHHSLPRARGRLSAAPELGPMPLVDGEKPGSAATRFGASWRAPRTAAVSGPCVTGRNLARLLRRRRKSSDAVISPPVHRVSVIVNSSSSILQPVYRQWMRLLVDHVTSHVLDVAHFIGSFLSARCPNSLHPRPNLNIIGNVGP